MLSAAAQIACLGLLLRASSAPAWIVSIDDAGHGTDAASAVIMDPSGDVVAAGYTHSPNPGGDFDGFVVKLSGSTGAEIWRHVFPGGAISAVKADARGDVIAGGSYQGAAVFRLLGTTGTEMWRYVLPEAGGSMNAVALDAGGDVIAVGATSSHLPALNHSFVAVRLAGTDGSERWRRQLPPSQVYPFDGASAVTVDLNGDVDVAGRTLRSRSANCTHPSEEFTILKLAGLTGQILWRRAIRGNACGASGGAGNTVALDHAGNVVAAGFTVNTGTGSTFTVVKVAAATGRELWRKTVLGTAPNGRAHALAIDRYGDVIAAGSVGNAGRGQDFTVVKLAGSTGVRRWRRIVLGKTRYAHPGTAVAVRASALALDTAGDVIAVGGLRNGESVGSTDFAVMKIARASGRVLWRRLFSGAPTGESAASAVAISPVGDVVAAGFVENLGSSFDFTVIHLAVAAEEPAP